MNGPPALYTLTWRLVSDRKTEGKDEPQFLAEVPIRSDMDMTPPPADPRGRWYSYVDYLDGGFKPAPEPKRENRWREAVTKNRYEE